MTTGIARRDEFLQALAEVLEVPSVQPSDDYRTTPLWGSLTCFSLKVMVQQRFGRDLSLTDLAACPTVSELAARVLE